MFLIATNLLESTCCNIHVVIADAFLYITKARDMYPRYGPCSKLGYPFFLPLASRGKTNSNLDDVGEKNRITLIHTNKKQVSNAP